MHATHVVYKHCIEEYTYCNSPSAVSVNSTNFDTLLNLTTAIFMFTVLTWSFVLIHIPPVVSDWHSLAVSGLFTLYHCVTVQSISATALVILLVSQAWSRLGEAGSSQHQHESYRKML